MAIKHLQHHREVKEAVFILITAAAFFMVVALLTFNHQDPGWSHFSAVTQYRNAGGQLGALISDIAYSAFGIFAYFIPLFLMLAGMQLLYRRTLTEQVTAWCFRSVGFIVTMTASCGLIECLFPWTLQKLPMGNGGILGRCLQLKLLPWLGSAGTGLTLLAGFLVGITLATGLSWFGLFDNVGIFFQGRLTKIKIGFFALMKKFKRKRRTPVLKSLEKQPAVLRSQIFSQTVTPQVTASPALLSKAATQQTEALPSIDLLQPPSFSQTVSALNAEQLKLLSADIEDRLMDFGISVKVVDAMPGPVITQFECEPAPGVKVSRIAALSKDLARALSVSRVRVLEVVPGKSVVGIEIPNPERTLVSLRSVLATDVYQSASDPLTLALGQDISGRPVIANLAKMPHLLVAGTTGSGKSVGVNAMLLSLLYKSTPDVLRLILVDPKMLELSVYADIPHLLTPVVTDMKEAAQALRWCVTEMDRRYQLMAQLGVRNIEGFNQKVSDGQKPLYAGYAQNGEPLAPLTPLPYIVVIIDEFADMMMVVGKRVEEFIARLAQKARAAGIHLILATQRPSVDVITGLIKANIPTRIAFQVSSKIDSRTILDQSGAEQLLGYGDMLYLPSGSGMPIRVHGAFVSDEEVHAVVRALKQQGPPNYQLNTADSEGFQKETDWAGELDPLYDEAVRIVLSSRRASISHVQRRLKIGYNRAARLIETMESAGLVSALQGNGNREVLVSE